MNSQQYQEIVGAMVRYFEAAKPNHDYNISLIRNDVRRFGDALIPAGIVVTISELQQFARETLYSFLGNEIEGNDQIVMLAMKRTTTLVSVVKAFGEHGIAVLIDLLAHELEDLTALTAYLLTNPDLIRSSSLQLLRNAHKKAYGTGCKAALAAALYKHGDGQALKAFAGQYLISKLEHEMTQSYLSTVLSNKNEIERVMLDEFVLPGSTGYLPLDEFGGVLRLIALDIATDGQAFMGQGSAWNRKRMAVTI